MALNDRELMLIDHYFQNGFDKVDAARKYGLSFPEKNASALFKREAIQAEIKRRRQKVMKSLDLDREWIVQRLMKLADAGSVLAKFKKVTEDGKLDWDFTGATQAELALINGLTVETYNEGRGPGAKKVKRFKIDANDPRGALDQLSRILGLYQDKVEIKGEVSLIDRIRAGRDRLAKEYKDQHGIKDE